jgi:hypothetical protein
MISKKERARLIGRISQASGITKYALSKKMTDEQVVEAVEHLEILELIKDANNYNRHCQRQKTAEANNKLKEFVSLDNSEFVKAGKWLLNAISMTGKERKATLLEKEILHKDDYNEMLSEMKDTIETILDSSESSIKEAETTIKSLEKKIDSLKIQLLKIQEYISINHSLDEWKLIAKTFEVEKNDNEHY